MRQVSDLTNAHLLHEENNRIALSSVVRIKRSVECMTTQLGTALE